DGGQFQFRAGGKSERQEGGGQREWMTGSFHGPILRVHRRLAKLFCQRAAASVTLLRCECSSGFVAASWRGRWPARSCNSTSATSPPTVRWQSFTPNC